MLMDLFLIMYLYIGHRKLVVPLAGLAEPGHHKADQSGTRRVNNYLGRDYITSKIHSQS